MPGAIVINDTNDDAVAVLVDDSDNDIARDNNVDGCPATSTAATTTSMTPPSTSARYMRLRRRKHAVPGACDIVGANDVDGNDVDKAVIRDTVPAACNCKRNDDLLESMRPLR